MKRVLILCLFLISCTLEIEVTDLAAEINPDPENTNTYQNNIKNIAFYYGWLNSLNSSELSWNNNSIINFLNQYDQLVVGYGIEDPSHPDYSNSLQILTGLESSVEVFGYVTLGNSYSESLTLIKQRIDRWVLLEVNGIFVDEAGFDYWNDDVEMRSRQNEIINYIHSKGLRVILNVWNPSDVFVKVPSNPTTVNNQDFILYESYHFSSEPVLSLSDHKAKMAILNQAKNDFGIGIIGVTTTSDTTSQFSQEDFDFVSLAAQIEGLTSMGWGTLNFSASGADNAIMPFRNINNNNILRIGLPISTNEIITQKYTNGFFELDLINKTFRFY